jgi:hypothetical protein
LFADKLSAMVGDTSFVIKPRLGEYLLLHKNQGMDCDIYCSEVTKVRLFLLLFVILLFVRSSFSFLCYF